MINVVENVLGRALSPDAMIYYVHTTRGKATGDGSIGGPYATFPQAQALCRTNRDDTVAFLPGSVIAVTASAGVTVSKGINLVGIGVGNLKPMIAISNSTSYMNFTAENIEVAGFRISDTGEATTECSRLLAFQASHFHIHHCEFTRVGGAHGPDIQLGASALKNMEIDHCRFADVSPITTCSSVTAIALGADSNNLRIHDNVFVGNWTGGCISASLSATGEAFLQISGNVAYCINSGAGCFIQAYGSDARGYTKGNKIVANVSSSAIVIADLVSTSSTEIAHFSLSVVAMTKGNFGEGMYRELLVASGEFVGAS